MDKTKKLRKLPERLRVVRDSLVYLLSVQDKTLTTEDIGLIFGINKGTVSRILDKEVDIINN